MRWFVAAAAAWSVVRLAGVDRRWPWRVAGLGTPQLRTHTPRGSTGPRADPVTSAARPTWRRHRARTRRVVEVDRDLVVAIDLLHVAISAGHSTHVAVAVVGRSGTGPVTRGLAEAAGQFERGRRLLEGLSEMAATLGPSVLPLVSTLNMALTSGAPLGPALQRLGDAERRRQRRRAETRARRLPVLLLAPVVGLVLPAFLVLTIVPVGLSAASGGLGSVIGAVAPTSFVDHWSTP